jgi:hypothetical protein
MKRRDLMLGSVALLGLSAVPAIVSGAEDVDGKERMREHYELRIYRCLSAEKKTQTVTYLEKALVPALNRMGLDRVGVFTQPDKPEDHAVFVLIPFSSLALFSHMNATLAADAIYIQEAQPYLSRAKNDPIYSRIDARLFKAFAGMPVLEMPPQTSARKPRIFEMRIYESHNEERAAMKVAMFNEGEIQIMRDTKLGPVFFGEALAGGNLPNLTYLLSADDMEAHKAHWVTFRAHPEWLRIKDMPRYKDTVSKIDSIFLVPTAFSQI